MEFTLHNALLKTKIELVSLLMNAQFTLHNALLKTKDSQDLLVAEIDLHYTMLY